MAYCSIWIRHHKGVSHDQIPVAATFENSDLRDASSGCDTTNIQLLCPNFYTILPMHWATHQISPMIILLQNRYLLPEKLVPYPLILSKYPFWFPVYTILFVIVSAVCFFQANFSLFLSTCAFGNGYIFCKPLRSLG